MLRMFLAVILALATGLPAAAQSTAINGTIEGTVTDEQGGVLPGVTVTVTNLDTGDVRAVVTNESGLYRAPLLSARPLPRRRGAQGFKKFEQSGVTLSAGQTAVINFRLTGRHAAGDGHRHRHSPLVDLGKIEQGRTLSEAEIKTLPLTSRNPYNFALLQPGVVGFETNEFGVPRLTANGALLRVNYQVDGSNNTQKDRAGLRQMPMSEVMIREVKVVTTGYAPEFGQTMGLVYNAITPSGNWLPFFRSRPNWQNNSAGLVMNTAGPICTACTSASATGSRASSASSRTISLAKVHSVAPASLRILPHHLIASAHALRIGHAALDAQARAPARPHARAAPGSMPSSTFTASAPTRPPTSRAHAPRRGWRTRSGCPPA